MAIQGSLPPSLILATDDGWPNGQNTEGKYFCYSKR